MFVTVKKETIIIISIISIIILLCGIFITTGAIAEVMSRNDRKIPIYRVETEEKVIALTFDAAWGADKTEGILDILQQYNAKSTFFLVGFWIDKFEDEVKLIDKRGMLIGNHSNNHLKMSLLKEENIVKELAYVNKRIGEITGKEVKFFRAPFGDYNDLLVNTVEAQGMMTIQWDTDSLDWKGLSAKDIKDRVLSRAKNGSIVLFHNNSDNILEALPLILLALKNQGYKFVTLNNLVYKDNYYIDNNGAQHKKL